MHWSFDLTCTQQGIFPSHNSELKSMTVVLCLNVSVLVAGLGGYGVESNGNVQEDFDSMEKEMLVTKLKHVGLQLICTAVELCSI